MTLHHQQKSSLTVQGEIRLADGLDSRMFKLMRAIAECGSINQAAKQMGLSYKSAWSMIERANNKSSQLLISSEAGGVRGGGTCLTHAGQAMLNLFTRLEQQHRQFLYELNQIVETEVEVLRLIKPLTIKTSAANQLFGVVIGLSMGIINTEVAIKLKGGEKLYASLSPAEVSAMQLKLGSEVIVLVDISEISLCVGPSNLRFSARNQFWGLINRVQLGEVEAKVVIYLSGGDSFTTQITRQSALSMGIKAGMQCWAVFKSNAVLLATL